MSEYDEKVPRALRERQEWFSSIIARPMEKESKMKTLSPSGLPMEREAEKYILPSPTLKPHERIELYNQQYWWRLLKALQEKFPLTTRLFGYKQFNKKIAIPYLSKYPSSHWSINELGRLLPKWAEEEYCGVNATLVREAVASDWAAIQAFFARELPHFTGEEADLAEVPLQLQPHLSLLAFTHNLLPFRDQIVDIDPNEVDRERFLKVEAERRYFFALYRNRYYTTTWTEIDEPQYLLLSAFKNPISISDACSWIEGQGESLQKCAEEKLHLFFQEWTARSWLGRA